MSLGLLWLDWPASDLLAAGGAVVAEAEAAGTGVVDESDDGEPVGETFAELVEESVAVAGAAFGSIGDAGALGGAS
jgi:hypothetical protein